MSELFADCEEFINTVVIFRRPILYCDICDRACASVIECDDTVRRCARCRQRLVRLLGVNGSQCQEQDQGQTT